MSTPTLGTTSSQTGLPSTAPQPVEPVVAERQITVAAASAAATAGLLALWAAAPVGDPFSWWYRGGSRAPAEKAFILVATAQEVAAASSRRFVLDVLAAQGHVVAVPQTRALSFAGVNSDGRTLESLLEQPLWSMRYAVSKGASEAEAKAAGALVFDRIVSTQVADAGRESTSVAITGSRVLRVSPRTLDAYDRDDRSAGRQALAVEVRRQVDDPDTADFVIGEAQRIVENEQNRLMIREAENELLRAARRAEREGRPSKRRETQVGWVRVLTPPSCGRCVALAGRFYKWSAGFERHPKCDCIHLPSTKNTSESFLTNPSDYFESLDAEAQDRAFGKSKAESIRLGADMNRVLNAYRKNAVTSVDGYSYTSDGTATRGRKQGFYAATEGGKAGSLRATPTTILRAADGDQAKAVRLLKRYGFIV